MQCPACFSDSTSVIKTYTQEGFTFHRCLNCAVYFCDPMKAGESGWYEQLEMYALPFQRTSYLRWYEKAFLKDQLLWKNKRILNLGCSRNNFLKEVQNHGAEIVAVDFNKKIVDFTKDLGIKDVFLAEAAEFITDYEGKRFDIFIAFEVIEHLEQPGEFLKSLQSVLNKGALIFLSVPNRGRFLAHMAKWDYPPHHLTRWDKVSLSTFLKISGFTVEQISISKLLADDLLEAIGIHFGAKFFENKVINGNSGSVILFLYWAASKFRVAFYKLLALVMRIFVKEGQNIYAVARFN